MGCVYFNESTLTWCEARRLCTSLGGDLAVVPSENFTALQQFLKNNENGVGEFS